MKNLEAVIPAYNEEGRVKNIIEILKSSPSVKKIIVVDDGSKDDTYNEAESAGADIVLRHSENKGKGTALRTGIEKVKKDTFLIIDADLKNFKNEHIDLLLKAYQKTSGAVLINGVMDRGEANQISKDFDKLITGVRLLTKTVWDEVKKDKNSDGYEIDYLIYSKAKKKGVVKTEVLPGLSQYKKTEKIGLFKGVLTHAGMFLKIIYGTGKRKLTRKTKRISSKASFTTGKKRRKKLD